MKQSLGQGWYIRDTIPPEFEWLFAGAEGEPTNCRNSLNYWVGKKLELEPQLAKLKLEEAKERQKEERALEERKRKEQAESGHESGVARKQLQKVVDLSHSIKRKERSEGHRSISEEETSVEEERSRSRQSGKEGSPTGKL